MIVLHIASPMCTIGEVTSRPIVENVQTSASSSEHHALSISCRLVRFLDLDVREKTKGWSQVYLVME